MTKFIRQLTLVCALIAACFPAAVAEPSTHGKLYPLDAGFFPEEFFPGLDAISREEILLSGLKSLFPSRILQEMPPSSERREEPPLTREVFPGVVYLRVHDLPSALPAIREHLEGSVLILDLRFVNADLVSTLRLGAILTRRETIGLLAAGNPPLPDLGDEIQQDLSIEGEGKRPPGFTVFTLSNHATEGALEALLAQLKADADIIAVGSNSPGRTASFRELPGFPGIRVMDGEIRPRTGSSLVDEGFIPRVHVTVSPDDDRRAYLALENDVPIERLVEARVARPRFDEARLVRERTNARSDPPNGESPATDPDQRDLPADLILQRAVNIVKALQALGEIP